MRKRFRAYAMLLFLCSFHSLSFFRLLCLCCSRFLFRPRTLRRVHNCRWVSRAWSAAARMHIQTSVTRGRSCVGSRCRGAPDKIAPEARWSYFWIGWWYSNERDKYVIVLSQYIVGASLLACVPARARDVDPPFRSPFLIALLSESSFSQLFSGGMISRLYVVLYRMRVINYTGCFITHGRNTWEGEFITHLCRVRFLWRLHDISADLLDTFSSGVIKKKKSKAKVSMLEYVSNFELVLYIIYCCGLQIWIFKLL